MNLSKTRSPSVHYLRSVLLLFAIIIKKAAFSEEVVFSSTVLRSTGLSEYKSQQKQQLQRTAKHSFSNSSIRKQKEDKLAHNKSIATTILELK
jgi:hypothetical protein